MKFRIITNGSKYRIQYKFFIFWKTICKKEYYDFLGTLKEVIEFDYIKDAKSWIYHNYGKRAEIVNNYWRPTA